ncbi:Acetyltransferase including N-acetylase of ribosomal protein [Rubrobacter radiotolerans]|uniref:Acetyltransferase including N-acetylase of ribosomal protein n=1 Tax=Rubrobacter radiotolerans TaxID=42256 RepID=A0A023X317_RUBRA|nr:Acetyltransferase including N-acetylase of ribosomal protein [Rubrobacter radiotolerans]SMC04880.1 Protein N-acetyltransferase, RimJ/RimL family [Rubrobacter radiotolerans DSM 5868]
MLSRRRGRRTSGRVELRPHERKDYGLYAQWYADWEIWNLSSWRPGPMNREETVRLFEEREASESDRSFAIHVAQEPEPVGVIGLMNINGAKLSADLSIIIGSPEHRRNGYGSEAIAQVLDFGFDELGLERISLSAFDFNEGAIHAYEKLGFRYDGRISNAIQREDGPHDAVLMRITPSEWRALRR